jgi:hypothetical protein
MKITSAMAGLNVHSDTFVACCTISHEVCPFQRHADLFELLNWLAGQGIMNAGMAATGIIYPQFSLRLPSGRGAT